MKKYLAVIDIKPQDRDDYIHIHQNPWPEMLEAIREAGFRKEVIWYHKDQSIIYLECEDDYEVCDRKLRETAVCKKWDLEMIPRFAGEPALPEKIFDLNQQLEGVLTQD